jgi:hypothetical protein
MNNNIIIYIAASFALASCLAPQAHAEDCHLMSQLRAEAEIDFQNVMGPKSKYGPHTNASTLVVPNAQCEISTTSMPDGRTYISHQCEWTLPDDRKKLDDTFFEMANDVAHCIQPYQEPSFTKDDYFYLYHADFNHGPDRYIGMDEGAAHRFWTIRLTYAIYKSPGDQE